MEDTRTKASNMCRLCLETLNTAKNIGIDLSTASEVRALVKEMYTVEVLATDQVRTICVPCYKSMMTHYQNLVHRRNKKRIVQMNLTVQLKLNVEAYQEHDARIDDTDAPNDGSRESLPSAANKQSRVIAPEAKDTVNSDPVPSTPEPVEQNNNTHKNSATKSASRNVAIRLERIVSDKKRSSMSSVVEEERKKSHKSSVERDQSFPNPGKSAAPTFGSGVQSSEKKNASSSAKKTGHRTAEKPSEKPSEKVLEKVLKKSSEKAPEKSSEKAPGKKIDKLPDSSSLVPVVRLIDCLAHPEYLDALFPLKISLGPDDVKPLEYLCDNCFLTFKTEDEYRSHRRQNCLRSCRYCCAKIKSHHFCALSSKYSALYPSIKGTGKYCTQYEQNTEKRKETEITENPKGKSSKTKPVIVEQNPESAAPIKNGLDKNKIRSDKLRKMSESSISTGSESTDSSSESSVEKSVLIASESDEEMKQLVNAIKRNVKKKLRMANRIFD